MYSFIFNLDVERTKRIFFSKKPSIKEFIKNQKNMLIKEEQEIFKHVPKILSVTLDRIIEIQKENNYTKEYIYDSFLNLSVWTNTQEKALHNVKQHINIGNYDLKDISDINILIELLYDWLLSDIDYIINIKSVDKFDSKLHQDIVHYIQNKNSNYANNLLIQNIKSFFSAVELECLICIAIFANKLYPSIDISNDINEELENYKDKYQTMLENILLRMLDYTADELYKNPDTQHSKTIFLKVSLLIDVVNFFAIIIDLEYNDSNSIFTIYNKKFSNFLKYKKILEFEKFKKDSHKNEIFHVPNSKQQEYSGNIEMEDISNHFLLKELFNSLERLDTIENNLGEKIPLVNETYDNIYNSLTMFKQKSLKPDKKGFNSPTKKRRLPKKEDSIKELQSPSTNKSMNLDLNLKAKEKNTHLEESMKLIMNMQTKLNDVVDNQNKKEETNKSAPNNEFRDH